MKRILFSIVCICFSFLAGCANPATTVQYVQPHPSRPPGASRIVVTNTVNVLDLLLFDQGDVLKDGKVLPKRMFLFMPRLDPIWHGERRVPRQTVMRGEATILAGEKQSDIIQQLYSLTPGWFTLKGEQKVTPMLDPKKGYFPTEEDARLFDPMKCPPKFGYTKGTGKSTSSFKPGQMITSTPIDVNRHMDAQDQACFFSSAQELHIFIEGNQTGLIGGKNQIVWDRMPGDLVISAYAKSNVMEHPPMTRIVSSSNIRTEPDRTYYFVAEREEYIKLDRVE